MIGSARDPFYGLNEEARRLVEVYRDIEVKEIHTVDGVSRTVRSETRLSLFTKIEFTGWVFSLPNPNGGSLWSRLNRLTVGEAVYFEMLQGHTCDSQPFYGTLKYILYLMDQNGVPIQSTIWPGIDPRLWVADVVTVNDFHGYEVMREIMAIPTPQFERLEKVG